MSQTKAPEILDEKYFLEAANDSARHFRSIYTVYLILLFFTAVILVSTDHELLFRAIGKQLPVININAPIVAFYVVMPWGLFIIHFYLLIQASFLADKVRLYIREIEKLRFKDSDKARKLLFPVPLAHILTGGKERGQWILRLIIILSLIIFPIVVLTFLQIRFLPYQNGVITWSHRIVIILDIILLWYFWNWRLFPLLENNKLAEKRWRILLVRIISFIFTILTVIFIIVGADFPSNTIYRSFTSSFHQYIEKPDWIKRIGASQMMLNRFELAGDTLVKREPSPEILAAYYTFDIKPGSKIWCEHATPLDLKNRNFRHANLEKAILCAANFTNADLTGAKLIEANLTDADLRLANLTDADLTDADLTDAYLFRANLTDADLTDADLRLANLTDADLTGADLRRANLTDAYLWRANLTDAYLRRANLTYADLTDADLTDAYLFRANLTDADLTDAYLYAADLTGADLRRANLTDAYLWRANLTDAYLRRANLTDAYLRRANLTDANLTDADLYAADLTGADLRRANLTGADLRRANLTDADIYAADLYAADLYAADLYAADLYAADLTNADLTNTTLSRAIFWGANISNADFTGAKNVNIELSWIREGTNKNKMQHRPKGIPKNTNIKSCPSDFDISDYINISDYLAADGTIAEEKRDGLKNAIKDTLDKHCQ